MKRIVTAVILLGAPPAGAQPAAQAEVLFRAGLEHMKEGKLAQACDELADSQRLDPTIVTLLNLADCREKNGQLATAWGHFLEAKRTTDPKLRKLAAERADKLVPRLSTLTVAVPEDARVAGLEVRRGELALAPASWNQAIPVDGGTYTVTARAPGNAEWSTTIAVAAERDVKQLEVPRLRPADLASPPPVAVDTPARAPEPMPAIAAEPPRRPSSRTPLLLGAGALAAIGGAVAFELSARSAYDDATREVDAARQLSRWRSANRQRYVAEAFAVAGAASAGVAIWLYVRQRRAPRIAPLAGGVGLQVQGGF